MGALRNVFWNGYEGRLRALWRIVLQLALTLALAALPLFVIGESLSYWRRGGLLASLDKESFDRIGNIVIAPVALLCIYLSLRIGVRRIERRARDRQLALDRRRFRA